VCATVVGERQTRHFVDVSRPNQKFVPPVTYGPTTTQPFQSGWLG